jgi:hypothetical protein
MDRTGILLIAAMAAPLLAACAGGASSDYIQAQEPRRIHSDASVSDLVLCLKGRLKEDASIVAYPEPGKVDVRVGRAESADTRYFYLISLRQAQRGTDVEIRSAGEWHPLMSPGRVAGMVEDCKPGTAR